jgi:uncharacterized membrane protein YidH (DUF202 family)
MLVLVLAVGVAAHFGVEAWLERIRGLPRAQAVATVSGAMRLGSLIIAVAVLFVGANYWRFGQRIKLGNRFPPIGAKTVRDFRVLTGAAAHRRGQLLQALAILLMLGAVAQFAMLLVLLSRLASSAA